MSLLFVSLSDVKPEKKIEKQGNWSDALDQLGEHEKLAEAVSNAVRVRRRYFKQRIKRTSKITGNLSK